MDSVTHTGIASLDATDAGDKPAGNKPDIELDLGVPVSAVKTILLKIFSENRRDNTLKWESSSIKKLTF